MEWSRWRDLAGGFAARRRLPPVFVRGDRIWNRLGGLSAFGSIPVYIIYWDRVHVLWPLIGAIYLVIIGAGWMQYRNKRRFRRMVVEAGGLICPHCGFDLRGCTLGRCPECGVEFEAEQTVRHWRVAFGDWEYET